MDTTAPSHEERQSRNVEIFRLYQSGVYQNELAHRFGLSSTTIWRIVQDVAREKGVRPRKAICRTHGYRTEVPKCQHCKTNVGSRARGLCYGCYLEPEIRELYSAPLRQKFGPSEVVDFNGPTKKPDAPTEALPGTPEKVAVLEERAKLGLSLWHPRDADPDMRDVPPAKKPVTESVNGDDDEEEDTSASDADLRPEKPVRAAGPGGVVRPGD